LGDGSCHLRDWSLQGSKNWWHASCKSPQSGIFNWETTVPVISWMEERFDKDWWWQSSIDYSVIWWDRPYSRRVFDGWDQWIRVVTAGTALYLDSILLWWLCCLGMRTEGKVVLTVFHVRYFQLFLSLASLFLLGAIITIGSKLGSILCIFKDPPGILSPWY
jgi:hypothetical protein